VILRLGVVSQLIAGLQRISWRVSDVDVAAREVPAKVISLENHVDRKASLTSKVVQFFDLFFDALRHQDIRRRRSR